LSYTGVTGLKMGKGVCIEEVHYAPGSCGTSGRPRAA
jgi:hypothetical protein